jgi:hypothetical protein
MEIHLYIEIAMWISMDNFVELTYIKYTPFIVVKKYRAFPKRGLAGTMLLVHKCSANVFKVLRIP